MNSPRASASGPTRRGAGWHERGSLALALALILAACGPAIPLPKGAAHLGDEPISVPAPPPPGKVEVVPKPPETLKKPVWVDGEWEWTGRRWQWKEGRWEEDRPGMSFAPAITVRREDGSLAHFPGVWKQDSGGTAAPAPTSSATAEPPASPK